MLLTKYESWIWFAIHGIFARGDEFRTWATRIFFLFFIFFYPIVQLQAQSVGPDDYLIYSLIVRNEISDTTRSIGLLRNGIDGMEVGGHTQNLILALKSGNQNSLQHLYSWTESGNGQRPTTIDTSMHPYILDFCAYPASGFGLSPRLHVPCRTIMLNRYPIREESAGEDWNHYYEKYPGSGGIFSFSRVLYYNKDWSTAIVYFWHRRYDLNGHGALAILKKMDRGWQIQYKTFLWWN